MLSAHCAPAAGLNRMTHVPSKTELDLSWPSLLEQLAGRCHTVRGAALARALAPLPSIADAHQRQAEIVEARALQDHGEPLSFGGIYDVATALERSSKGGVLDPDELVELGSTLLGATRLRRHVLSRAAELPRLCAHASDLAELPEVTGPIADSFDEGRKLKDGASPALGGLRQRVNHLLAELGRRTDGLLNEPHIGPYLMDRFVTQREDRYVVPVRADSRTRVRGIVHGTSSSGATIFVEPEEIIDLNNRLKLAQLEVAEEERRILAELSLRIQQAAPEIARNLTLLALLDLIDGSARLAIDLRANAVTLLDPAADAASVDLRNGRHPLMVLAGTQVVANDVALPSRGTLIISGPNAGGKTVSLKLTGLCVLMARVGLLLPVQEGSSLPWFDEVLTDVGDDQSLEKNLSTFSAHIHNLRRFLAAARPGTLVLLDEIAVGTDPEQGAALAQAVLETLARSGATVLVTTHYDRLKALGATGAPFANASVGYDLVRLAPTYRLHLGIPGASSALPVAERLGLPATIVARAQTLLSDAHSGLDRLLQTLSGERERSETARRAAEEHRAEAQRQSAQAAQLREEAQQALRRAQRQAHDEAIEALRIARRQLLEARDEARALGRRLHTASTEQGQQSELQGLQRRIDSASNEIAALAPPRQAPAGKPPTEADLPLGTRVYVSRMGAVGTVASDCSRGKVIVQVGSLRANVDLSDLLLPDAQGRVPAKSGGSASSPMIQVSVEASSPVPPRTPDSTLDLRGERAHIAIARAEKFVDDALRESRSAVFILHGHGTGILRQAIRSHFAAFPGIRRVRSADSNDGGDGVTVLELDR